MPDTPLNPDALEAGAKALFMRERKYHTPSIECPEPPNWEDLTETSMEHYRGNARAVLAVAQPEVNSFDPRALNRKGWTCGCEPGNYDTCDECQSACNELANFLNRPEVNDA